MIKCLFGSSNFAMWTAPASLKRFYLNGDTLKSSFTHTRKMVVLKIF